MHLTARRRAGSLAQRCLGLTLVLCIALPNQSRALDWAQAFPTGAALRKPLYFVARFFDARSGWHRLQSWRLGTEFLHRKTDEQLDLYASRSDGRGYAYALVDHRRRAVFHADQGQLYRIGVFSDWFGLAHGLGRPAAPFRLERSVARGDEHASSCRWIVLTQRTRSGDRRSRICWSARFGLPLLIREENRDGGFQDRFAVDEAREIPEGERAALRVPVMPDGYATFGAEQAGLTPD